MKKLLKYLVILLLVVIVGGFTYVATIPSDYNVSTSKVIKAPVSLIFNTVNDLKTWETWGPWYQKDTTIVVTYGDITTGIGASNSWTNKDGSGKMKTIALVPNKSIDQEMQFEDYEPSSIHWAFEEIGEEVKVTWTMKGDNVPFIFKIFAAFSGGWKGVFGPDQQEGLENIDKLIAEKLKEMNSFKIGKISSDRMDAKKFIGFYHKGNTDVSHEEMTKLFMQDMPKAGMYAAQKGLQLGDYTPGSVYTKWDEETKEAEFYIGLLLHKKLNPAKGMKAVYIPKGKIVKVSKFGNYGTGDMEAHVKIAQYLEANKLEATNLVWELYVNDPTTVKPQDIQTDIYYRVK